MATQEVAHLVPEMSRKAKSLLKKLTPAQQAAIREARWGNSLGGYFLGLSVRVDVRRKLREMGILGKNSHVLTVPGQELRRALGGEGQ